MLMICDIGKNQEKRYRFTAREENNLNNSNVNDWRYGEKQRETSYSMLHLN